MFNVVSAKLFLLLFFPGQTVHVRQSVSVKYNTGTSVQCLRPEDCQR